MYNKHIHFSTRARHTHENTEQNICFLLQATHSIACSVAYLALYAEECFLLCCRIKVRSSTADCFRFSNDRIRCRCQCASRSWGSRSIAELRSSSAYFILPSFEQTTFINKNHLLINVLLHIKCFKKFFPNFIKH